MNSEHERWRILNKLTHFESHVTPESLAEVKFSYPEMVKTWRGNFIHSLDAVAFFALVDELTCVQSKKVALCGNIQLLARNGNILFNSTLLFYMLSSQGLL